MTHKPPQGIDAGLRDVLSETADQLDRWADESRNGGWSTHQVDPMRRKADELRRALAAAPPDPRKDLALDDAIQCAARDLPERWRIEVVVEKSSGWVNLYDPKDDCLPDSVTGVSPDFNLEEQVRYLTKWAVAAEMRGAKR